MRSGARIIVAGLVAAILLLAPAAPAAAAERLSNGGFEAGISGWEAWHCEGAGTAGVTYSVSTDTRPGSRGRRSLQIDTTAEFACSNWIRQAVRGLEGGKVYRMSIWYKVAAGGAPDGPVQNVIVRNMKNDTNQDRKDLPLDMATDGVWKHISQEFTTHPSTTPDDFYRMIVNPYPREKGGKGATIRVDDFSLRERRPEDVEPDAPGPVLAMVDGLLTKLLGGATEPQARGTRAVAAGLLDGYPYLRNNNVIYLWSKPANGGGLLAIRDVRSGKQLLRVEESKAILWKIAVKNAAGKSLTCENAGMPCDARFDADADQARLSFTWRQPDIEVVVRARLPADESLVRLRLTATATSPDTGLLTVTFPVVQGILPLSEQVEGDRILTSRRRGMTVPSPLVTQKELKLAYPIGMNLQMGALLGDGGGLYFGEEDEQAHEKILVWTPDADAGSLTCSVAHPVFGWGGDEPVREYASPGDVVMGPFQGDWFDAARVYRRWALTAPWCDKGPMHARSDYPQWLARVPYWTNGALRDEEGIRREIVKQEFFDFPESVCHDYYYTFGFLHHDRNPEYLPPRIGSENYKRVIKDMRGRGVRVIPYVIGWLWNMTTESYRVEQAEKSAMLGQSGDVLWTWAGGNDPQAAMCPATPQWRNKLTGLATELVGKYGLAGVYFDYFTVHQADCFNKDHGHPIGGGNYWTRSVHELYEQVRAACREIDPEVMLCGENAAEWCIDVLDTVYEAGPSSNAPVFLAVYHGYTQIFSGGLTNRYRPPFVGRQWLMGCQNGWLHQEYTIATSPAASYRRAGPYYRQLIRCHWEFARPYLVYGEMLRPPKIEGAFPLIPVPDFHEAPREVEAVEGSAWRAPDGTVGLFFLNYHDDTEYEFSWTKDLNEIAGIGADNKMKVSRWTPDGEEVLGEWAGGVVNKTMKIAPWGMIALKLEVLP